MSAQILRALFVLAVLFPRAVHCSNSANVTQGPHYVGWYDAPNERGTISLLWTCLSTIIISTWTILHLNVPSRHDTTVQKMKRKIKWMGVTILFPEITFAKAVCELQMAVEDLFLLHDIEEDIQKKTGWKVEVGRVTRILYRSFHPFKSQDNDPPEARNISNELQRPELIDNEEGVESGSEEPRHGDRTPTPAQRPMEATWTLTHSYLANMGGIHIKKTVYMYRFFENPPDRSYPITTFVLAKCCARKNHSLFLRLYINKADIEDKSKANWLNKSVAIAQISWLLISVCARKARSLTISQIEVCTVAFAALATATWLANWYKPKDIGRPITIELGEKNIRDDEYCKSPNIYMDSYRRLSKVYRLETEYSFERIKNDFIRFDSNSPTVAYLIAVSTAFFGGIHLLAWNSEFPSRAEATIWRMAGILTTTIPLVSIILIGLNSRIINRQIDDLVSTLKKEFANSSNAENLFQNNETLQDKDLEELLDWSEIMDIKGGHHFIRSLHRECRSLFGSAHSYHNRNFLIYPTFYRYQQPPTMSKLPARHPSTLQDELQFMINLINGERHCEVANKRYKTLRLRKGKISGAIMIVTGFLYSVFRLMMLAVAFTALRHQDERLYLNTWTKYLPNIS